MHSIRRPIFCVAFILLVVAGLAVLRAADRAPAVPETESIAKALEGVWGHVGEPGNVRPAPKSGGRPSFA